MGKVYKNQTAFTIRLTTGQDITAADPVKIKYRKPSGATGEWVGSINDEAEGIVEYEMADEDDLDESGWWMVLWPGRQPDIQAALQMVMVTL